MKRPIGFERGLTRRLMIEIDLGTVFVRILNLCACVAHYDKSSLAIVEKKNYNKHSIYIREDFFC